MSAFSDTNDLFRNHLEYTRPISYVEWLALSQDKKSALLFVQFYEQITLAWYKTKSYYAQDEDGVSTVLQYLMKNVPVIENDEKRFTPNYIYKVAYNCLYCICHDIKRDKDRAEKEISNIVVTTDDELDLFDTVMVDDTTFDSVLRNTLWEVVNELGPKAKKYVIQTMSGTSINATSLLHDEIDEIKLSLKDIEAIVAELRDKLKNIA